MTSASSVSHPEGHPATVCSVGFAGGTHLWGSQGRPRKRAPCQAPAPLKAAVESIAVTLHPLPTATPFLTTLCGGEFTFACVTDPKPGSPPSHDLGPFLPPVPPELAAKSRASDTHTEREYESTGKRPALQETPARGLRCDTETQQSWPGAGGQVRMRVAAGQ